MPTGRHKKTKKGGFLGFGDSTSTNVPSTNVPSSNVPSSDMFGSIGSTLSGWGTSLSDTASTALNKTKNAFNSDSGSPSYAQPATPAPTTPYTPSFGGKNKSKKRSRKMRGGYRDNIADTGLAATAASISDIKSAQPLNIVGGKRRSKKCRRNRNAKSCKRRRR